MRIARFTSLVLASMLALPFMLAACSSDAGADADPFDTLQACYDDHHNVESLPVQQAIVVCCIDHPIAGVHPSCGNTQAECVTHVDSEITDTTVTAADIDAACADYIDKK